MDFLKFVILWNWFKKRHCSILTSKKQCQNFWSLKSLLLKKHLGYQPFCSWTRVLFSETASKTTLFHLEFKRKRCQNFWGLKSWVLKKHLGYQPFCSWTRVLSSKTASKPTLFHLEFQKNSVNFFGVFWVLITTFGKTGSSFLKLLQDRHDSNLTCWNFVSTVLGFPKSSKALLACPYSALPDPPPGSKNYSKKNYATMSHRLWNNFLVEGP